MMDWLTEEQREEWRSGGRFTPSYMMVLDLESWNHGDLYKWKLEHLRWLSSTGKDSGEEFERELQSGKWGKV